MEWRSDEIARGDGKGEERKNGKHNYAFSGGMTEGSTDEMKVRRIARTGHWQKQQVFSCDHRSRGTSLPECRRFFTLRQTPHHVLPPPPPSSSSDTLWWIPRRRRRARPPPAQCLRRRLLNRPISFGANSPSSPRGRRRCSCRPCCFWPCVEGQYCPPTQPLSRAGLQSICC